MEIQQEEILTNVLNILKECAEGRRMETDVLMKILSESEGRIGNVNKMISDLTAVMREMTEKYVTHLEQVCVNRNQMIEQNKKLLDQNIRLEEDLRRERERNMELVKQIVFLMHGQKADTIINNK